MSMSYKAKLWLHGLGASVITSISTAGLAAAGSAAFDVALNGKQLLITCVSAGLVGAFAYLKQSPLPPPEKVKTDKEETL